ncbi:hypothetical protein NEOKW01_1748 [Nematocida sp. AWRm80]|nr:hypothetical protein NEOKW01_1748 [Nematocida sp. AWRm80]
MPIRELEKELNTKNGIKVVGVETLEDKVLGVDGAWFVRKYSGPLKKQEVLMSGMSSGILESVRALIEAMEEIECRIVWIWNGIKPRTGMQKSYNSLRIDKIQEGWDLYTNHNYEKAGKVWAVSIDYEEIMQQVNQVLREKKIEIINAPYSACAQAAYMCQKNYINIYFGPTDYMLFSGSANMIVSFIFVETGNGKKRITRMTTLHKEIFVKAIDVPEERLVDIALMMGCEYCPTVPEYSDQFSIEDVITTCLDYPSTSAYLRKIQETPEGQAYVNKFLAGKACIEYHPVLTETGEIQTLNTVDVPYDLKRIFGKKIPDQLYLRYAKGYCSLEYLSGIVFSEVHAMCSEDMFKCIKPLAYNLYGPNTKFTLTGIAKDTNCHTSITSRVEMPQMLGKDVNVVSGLPVALQYLILLLEKTDQTHLSNLFVFNKVLSKLDIDEEEPDWDVFEFAESSRLLLDIIKNINPQESITPLAEIVPMDPANGWRMASVLHQLRKKRTPKALQDYTKLIEDNLEFMKHLLIFFENNCLGSLKIKQEIETLVNFVSNKESHAQDMPALQQ